MNHKITKKNKSQTHQVQKLDNTMSKNVWNKTVGINKETTKNRVVAPISFLRARIT